MNADLTKKARNEKDFFKLINNAVFGKTIENVGNIEILNLSQQKEGETVWCQDQIIILQSFSQNIY